MRYYLDQEFIESFHKPLFGKKRHYIDLISIGIVDENGREYYAISREYDYKDADPWVKENVIIPAYSKACHGDMRNHMNASNFNKRIGKSIEEIKTDLLEFFGCYHDHHFWRAPEGIEMYGYYADYDWVLFCSIFGRMIDLPKGFPMYCHDLKQTLHELGLEGKWGGLPVQVDEHIAISDARWIKQLHNATKTEICYNQMSNWQRGAQK